MIKCGDDFVILYWIVSKWTFDALASSLFSSERLSVEFLFSGLHIQPVEVSTRRLIVT